MLTKLISLIFSNMLPEIGKKLVLKFRKIISDIAINI